MMRQAIGFVAVAAMLWVIAACTDTTPATPATPTVEPAPLPTLTGTWSRTTRWVSDEDGLPYSEIRLLTFTPDRYVETIVVLNANDEITEDLKEQGTWTEADGMVTQIWRDWDDDLDMLEDHDTRREKGYYWGNTERTLLLMTDWSDQEADPESYVAYRRVQNPLPSLMGTWVIYEGERPSSLGFDPDSQRRTKGITINLDNNTFSYTTTRGTNSGSTMSGTFEQDAENHILRLMPTQMDVLENGETPSNIERIRNRHIGHRLTFRYAPTNEHSAVRVSPWYIEQQWDPNDMTWKPGSSWPYGDFYRIMVKP